MNRDTSYIGLTTFRNLGTPFGIKQTDRLSHLYIVGKTGTGKSTLLEALALQDLEAGRGFVLIDPHGDLVEHIAMNADGRPAVRYLNVADQAQPYGYNPLRHVRDDKISLAASGLMEALKSRWGEASWGVRMEHVLRNVLFALLEQKDANLADIPRLFSDKTFRRQVVDSLRNEQVRRFWLYEYERYSPYYRADAIAPIQNKIGAFLADPTLRRILTEPKEDLHIRRMMDRGEVLLVNLARGQIGEDSASLLGSLLVTTIGLAAFSRADTPEGQRCSFFVYLDEFQSFTSRSVAEMISELRKYGVGLVLAHQHLHQLEPEIRHAVLGNAGTIIAFRVGPEDAAFLAREFQPRFEPLDLLSLSNHHICVKLVIDGEPTQGFSAKTLQAQELSALLTA